ncbi:hypothetical protein ABT187_40805 [Streptomyces sp. NPDC001817]|uniref:hypothetical protein n=1 Tax=Streptomyces sp. NPDC001817 TaxID=3154398 RepID=UPI00332D4C4B
MKFLDRLIGWPLAYWSENLPRVREVLEQRLGPVDDDQSVQALVELKRAVLDA